MKNRQRWFLVSVLAMLLITCLWSQGIVHAKPSLQGNGWSVVTSANLAGQQDHLISVSADTHNDAWAIGVNDASLSAPFLEHWNGTRWALVTIPQFDYTVQLRAIVALTPNNVWVVGNLSTRAYQHTFVGHWDGSHWSRIASPNESQTEFLYAVTAVSANNIWAVGSDFSRYHTLIEHWNGKQWSIVPSPNANSLDNELYDVKALSSTDVWAVGSTDLNYGGYQPLLEHWNGKAWTLIAGPHPGGRSGAQLYAVTPHAPNDVWAVGYIQGMTQRSLIEHWNGKQWSVVSSPNPSQGSTVLRGVIALSTNDVWAIGYIIDVGSRLLHWNGTSWSNVKSPDSTLFDSQLYAAAIVQGQGIWAVGSVVQNSADATLTDFYN